MEAAGCEIVELTPDQHSAFVAAVQPLLREARGEYGDGLFELAAGASTS
jgi:hypothetical protein